jgi:hypothetical protein
MRRKLAVTTGIAAGVTAIALVAAPTLAQAAPWSTTPTPDSTSCPRYDGATRAGAGAGYGMGRGAGNGPGAGPASRMQGSMAGQSTVASGTLTATQKTMVAAMAEEEKLAHDLYVALGAKYPDVVQFSRIARSETMHLTAVRTLLTTYGITDPTAGLAAGTFASPAVQTLYDDLLKGATTSTAALAAGVTVEKLDIEGLTVALSGVTAPDVVQVLTNLLAGSQRHLVAFGG